MASAEEERDRTMNSSSTESEVRVDGANKHPNDCKQGNITNTARKLSNIWTKANAVGETKKTVEEVKRRWKK